MRTKRFADSCRRASFFLLLTVGIASCFPDSALAQKQGDEKKTEVRIIPVQYHKASELATILQKLFRANPHVQFSASDSTNSVIISAPASDLHSILKVMNELEERGLAARESHEKGRQPSDLRIIGLKHAGPDDGLETILKSLMPEVKVALDRPNRRLLLSASPDNLDKAARLLDRLDQPQEATKTGTGEVRVRIIWLIDASNLKIDKIPIPEDLKSVVAELKKLGLKTPQIEGEVSVYTQANAHFEVQGTVLGFAVLRANGTFRPNPEKPSLEIHIETSNPNGGQPPQPFAPYSKLGTTIMAPLGHFVVLGMTPADLTNSVFVVQVLPKKLEKSPAKQP